MLGDAAGRHGGMLSPRRQLKRTPSAVTRDYVYREVRATLEQAQDQERRYRMAFQGAMRSGQPLDLRKARLLRRNPLATALLERLVLIDAAGAVDCSGRRTWRSKVSMVNGYISAGP